MAIQRGFIFDLDGTVYLDNHLIDGAKEAINWLKERGDRVVYLTNKSIETIDSYIQKLSRLGIEVEKNEVVNSNFLTARYLASRLAEHEKVMVIGEQPLVDELELMGIQTSNDENEVSYVVVGWDREFSYDKINRAFQAWKNGATILATNPDRTCPVPGGEIPDCGAMIGAIEGATGEKVELILGKPSPLAVDFIVDEILQLPRQNCFMVGDRLETDIRMGNECDLQSVLVLTGITTEEMLDDAKDKPKYVLDSIKDIPRIPTGQDSKTLDYLKK